MSEHYGDWRNALGVLLLRHGLTTDQVTEVCDDAALTVDALRARVAELEAVVERLTAERDEARHGTVRHECAECGCELWAESQQIIICGSCTCLAFERRAEAAEARVAELERERDKARDCKQDGVCAIAPGCQRHWAERNRELVRERDALRDGKVDAHILRLVQRVERTRCASIVRRFAGDDAALRGLADKIGEARDG